MLGETESRILWSTISALVAGLVGSTATYFFTKPKMLAEIANLKATTEKTQLENAKMAQELSEVRADLNQITDGQVIYDSTKSDLSASFEIAGFSEFKNDKPISKAASGSVSCAPQLLSIERTNTEGRYTLQLVTHCYEGKLLQEIPPNPAIAGKRTFRIECRAKAASGNHTLRFLLKNKENKTWLGSQKVQLEGNNSWKDIRLHLHVDPLLNCSFRIDDIEVSQVPSSFQIAKVIVTETKFGL